MQIQDGNNIYTEDRECKYMTRECYPDKITVEEFAMAVSEGISPFVANMEAYGQFKTPKYAEDWMEKFQVLMEMEKADIQ